MRRLVIVAHASCSLSACADTGPSPAAPTPAPGPTILFDDIRLLDGERSIERADVSVRGDRIIEIADHIVAPTGTPIVSSAVMTLLPGLVRRVVMSALIGGARPRRCTLQIDDASFAP